MECCHLSSLRQSSPVTNIQLYNCTNTNIQFQKIKSVQLYKYPNILFLNRSSSLMLHLKCTTITKQNIILEGLSVSVMTIVQCLSVSVTGPKGRQWGGLGTPGHLGPTTWGPLKPVTSGGPPVQRSATGKFQGLRNSGTFRARLLKNCIFMERPRRS